MKPPQEPEEVGAIFISLVLMKWAERKMDLPGVPLPENWRSWELESRSARFQTRGMGQAAEAQAGGDVCPRGSKAPGCQCQPA